METKVLKYEDYLNMYEYQFRDIDIGIYYKRLKGTDIWYFIDKEEFCKNATKENIIKYTNI